MPHQAVQQAIPAIQPSTTTESKRSAPSSPSPIQTLQISPPESCTSTATQPALPTAGRVAHCLAQLEAGYLGSLDTGGSERVLPGVLPTPIPVSSISHIGQVTGQTAADRGGDTNSDTCRSRQWSRPPPAKINP